MDIYKVIENLERKLSACPKIPLLSDYSIVRRERFMEALKQLRNSIPEEIEQSVMVLDRADQVRDQAEAEAEHIIKDAQAEADRILTEAENRGKEMLTAADHESRRMISQTEVMKRAQNEAAALRQAADAAAQQTMAEAEAESKRLRGEAREYADNTCQDAERFAYRIFCGLEEKMNGMMDLVKRGKASLGEEAEEGASSRSESQSSRKRR